MSRRLAKGESWPTDSEPMACWKPAGGRPMVSRWPTDGGSMADPMVSRWPTDGESMAWLKAQTRWSITMVSRWPADGESMADRWCADGRSDGEPMADRWWAELTDRWWADDRPMVSWWSIRWRVDGLSKVFRLWHDSHDWLHMASNHSYNVSHLSPNWDFNRHRIVHNNYYYYHAVRRNNSRTRRAKFDSHVDLI